MRNDPAGELALFRDMYEQDAAHRSAFRWHESWPHLDRRLAQGALRDMAFHTFLGAEHLARLYAWIGGISYPNFIADEAFQRLVARSRENDLNAFASLGLPPNERSLDAVALYNAQDYHLQHACPGPDRYRVRSFLDFGAGHGRQANLWFAADNALETFIAVDAFPAPYLTQRVYYSALALSVHDYMDHRQGYAIGPGRTVHHLPSWRLDLVPDDSVDMVCAVQVLRELSKPMLVFAVRQFHRALRSGGALYIRDHIGFHNVNQVDLDALLRSAGFVAEWQPHWIDRVDIHGVPRIWRKADAEAVVGGLG